MNQSPVKVKTEKGTVQGSLGSLLSSYANSSSDDDDDNDTESAVKPPKSPELLPNPFAQGKSVGSGSGSLTGNETSPGSPLSKRCAAIFPIKVEKQETDTVEPAVTIKQEPIEVEEVVKTEEFGKKAGDEDVEFLDFASFKEEKKDNLELDEEDFFGGATETYSEVREIKQEVESDSDTSSGTSESEEDSEDSEEDEDNGINGTSDSGEKSKLKKQRDRDGPRVKGELRLCDLPPIEDLHISVPHDDCKSIGTIKSVVEPLVVVEAYPDTPALDLDSVLFLEEGDRALGKIFDVIGPVRQPLYCVRFNSKEHIEKNKVEVGMSVYCAPKTPYTSFVFLAQLRNMKGSDASWMNDDEPPVEEEDFSDDEMERFAKKKRRNRRRPKINATEADAMYTEGQSTADNQNRGKKRNFNSEGGHSHQSYNHEENGPFPPNHYPPFYPPMVPGFLPYGPTVGPYGAGFQYHQFPQFRGNMHRPRGRGRPHQNFRLPHPQQMSSFHPIPPEQQRPWFPPYQWQNAPTENFNFGGAAQFRPQPPPPPPPPPPPAT